MKTALYATLCTAMLFGFGGLCARAGDFVCTPDAIHAKSVYTKALWKRLEDDKIKDDDIPAALDKLWDGNGDCNGDEDGFKSFSFSTLSELVQTHYLGDMMSATFDDGLKQYGAARKHLDDFWDAEGFVQEHADRMPSSFMAEDNEIVGMMKKLDAKLTKLGYGTKHKK